MCFRPSNIDTGPVQCPECGKEVDGAATMTKCPHCGAKASASPSAPGAPKAQKAPGAPKAPGVQLQ